ncbi:MAG: IgGFc-binding protein, partial [Bacteroidales bacterium]|nr:IgGFc-binding protein [Bacteroidales bacterium]
MLRQLRFLIVAVFFMPFSSQIIAQDQLPTHQCDGCQVYTEEQLQDMRDAYEPYAQVSGQRMPESFKSVEQYDGRQDLSNQGTDFWLMFMSNYNNSGINLFLDITSDANTSGTVTLDGIGFSQNFTVTANTITRVNLPANAVVSGNQTPQQRGIRVIANDPVTVYGTNQIQYTTDSFLGLPVNILGTQYLTMTYSNNSEFGIVSPYDNNIVTITPSYTTNAGNQAGVPFNVNLNQGETYLVFGYDLTGSIIESSLPVSVFSGATCTNIPVGFGYCDHIVQQIPPVSSWGETFVTRPLEGRNNGDTWRFLASQDNTELIINGAVVATLNFADYYETMLSVASYVESSNPILATQFANGNTWDGSAYPGDPFMMIIPPYQQFLEGYTFGTPANGFVANYFTTTVDDDGVVGMTLDGAPLNAASFAPVSTTTFSAGAFPININSTYNLANTNGYTSGLYVYGFNADDSYGYPGGLSLITINEGSGPEIVLGSTVVDLFCVSNESGVDLEITAIITDPEEPFVQSATVFWRSIGDGAYTSVPMTDDGGNNWSATISSTETEYPGIELYISASDGQVTNTSPSTDPINNPYSVGIENIPPDITHMPVMIAEPGVDILIEAEVFDDTESVASVELFYRVPGGTPIYTEMAFGNTGGDAWESTIPGSAMTAQGLEYYIKATDNFGVSCTFGSADDPFLIEAGSMANIPPVPVGFPVVAPQVANGETYNLTVQFQSPEDGQTTDVVVNDGGLAGFSYTVTPGNIAVVEIELVGQNDNLGTHTIEFVATDNGEPVESTTVMFNITVYDPLSGHVICIPEGWSLISSYNDPANPDMEDIFADLVASGKVEFVFNQDGIFWPSQNINLFEGWDVKKGYKIKMNEEGCLGIIGEMPEDKSFTAPVGVSYVPVLCSEPVAAVDIFSQMGDDLQYAFDIYDQLVYWPEGGLFTLNTLEPG